MFESYISRPASMLFWSSPRINLFGRCNSFNAGQLLNSDVTGQVIMKCHLSGQPECKFGMNEKLALYEIGGSVLGGKKQASCRRRQFSWWSIHLIFLYYSDQAGRRNVSPYQTNPVALDDVRFHQCVRISRFEVDRTITFVPPDGTFELMT